MKIAELNELASIHPLSSLPHGDEIAHLVGQIGFWPAADFVDFATRSLVGIYGDAPDMRSAVEEWHRQEVDRRIAAGDVTMPATVEEKRVEMVRLMSEISEEIWCAGWLTGLEEIVWRMLEGERSVPESVTDEVEAVRRLRDASGEFPGPCGRDEEIASRWVDDTEARRVFSTPRPSI